MTSARCRPRWLLAAFAACALAAVSVPAATIEQADVPYVPTPPAVVEAMLKLADVGARDFVIDLGSGDGRILIAAAKRHGARGLGVEIDGNLVHDARREAARQGVGALVEFREENLYVTNLRRASVLTLYLYPRLMADLRLRFLALEPGSRIVSHDFGMDDWQPDARVTVPVPDKPYGPPRSEVYLWIVPANVAGAWRWRSASGADAELTLTQTFQVLDGRALVGGRPGRIEDGRVRGEEIRFILTAVTDGRTLRQEFRGRVRGDTIQGTVKTAGGVAGWNAKRSRRGSITTVTGDR